MSLHRTPVCYGVLEKSLQQKQAMCHRQKSLKRELDALAQCLPIKTMLLFIDYVRVGSLEKTALFSLINQVKMTWAKSSATDFQGRRTKSFPIQRRGKAWKRAFEKALTLMLKGLLWSSALTIPAQPKALILCNSLIMYSTCNSKEKQERGNKDSNRDIFTIQQAK